VASKGPSGVKADRDVADFILSLEKGSYLLKIVNNGLDELRGNMFAGERIEKRKFPKRFGYR
jgi:hypothetical protein